MEKLFDSAHPLPNTLTQLLAQADTQQALRDRLRDFLPLAIRDALTDCIIQADSLTLTTYSSALLNRLRLHQSQFLTCAQQHYPELTEVRYLLATRPAFADPARAPRQFNRPVAQDSTSTELNALAEQIEDAELSQSLKALSLALSRHRESAQAASL